jgi:hypothetical protein
MGINHEVHSSDSTTRYVGLVHICQPDMYGNFLHRNKRLGIAMGKKVYGIAVQPGKELNINVCMN